MRVILEMRSSVKMLSSSTAAALPLPRWGRLRSIPIFCKRLDFISIIQTFSIRRYIPIKHTLCFYDWISSLPSPSVDEESSSLIIKKESRAKPPINQTVDGRFFMRFCFYCLCSSTVTIPSSSSMVPVYSGAVGAVKDANKSCAS